MITVAEEYYSLTDTFTIHFVARKNSKLDQNWMKLDTLPSGSHAAKKMNTRAFHRLLANLEQQKKSFEVER